MPDRLYALPLQFLDLSKHLLRLIAAFSQIESELLRLVGDVALAGELRNDHPLLVAD